MKEEGDPKPWITWAIVLAIVAGGGYGFWRWHGKQRVKPIKFETAQIDRGTVAAKVTASGTISSLVTVQVGSQVSGRVAEIDADFNAPVKKGMVLAKIDPRSFEAVLQQAQANEVAARANLTKARVLAADADRQWKRAKELAERKLVAEADRDTAQANADGAHAQVIAASGEVTQAEAARHLAEVNLAYTTIVSPIDGVVISRNVDVGQTVAASLQAPVLFTIAQDLAKMQVDSSVAEADVGKLSPGMPAMFTVDAFPGVKFGGTVRQIRNAPQTVQNVVTYDAVIDVDNRDLKLRPGMTANITFVVAQRENVLCVPNAALRYRPPAAKDGKGDKGDEKDKDKRTVWVLKDGTPTPVKIVTGVTDSSMTEVVSGDLSEGDEVITDATGGAAPPKKGGQQGPGAARRMF